jgi:cytochrome c oxidase subunit II
MAVGAALLLVACFGGCGGGGGGGAKSTPAVPAAGSGSEIDVNAKAFSFSPSTVTVKAGQPVTLVLEATDIAHDFTVDQPKIHIAASGGDTARGQLDVATPGTYTFYCSVAGHRAAGMVGKLVVTP